MKRKALIISIKGTKLSKMEKILLSKGKPWGVILFKRNLRSARQIKNLTSNIRTIMKNKKFPIMIDEEGTSVSRLRNLINFLQTWFVSESFLYFQFSSLPLNNLAIFFFNIIFVKFLILVF